MLGYEDGSYMLLAPELTAAFLPPEVAMGGEGGCGEGSSLPCPTAVTRSCSSS